MHSFLTSFSFWYYFWKHLEVSSTCNNLHIFEAYNLRILTYARTLKSPQPSEWMSSSLPSFLCSRDPPPSPFLLPQPQATTDSSAFYQDRLFAGNSHFLDFYINGTIQYVVFCVYLLSLKIIIWRFTHGVARILVNSFLLY